MAAHRNLLFGAPRFNAVRVLEPTDTVGFVGTSSLARLGLAASRTNLPREFKEWKAPGAKLFGKARSN